MSIKDFDLNFFSLQGKTAIVTGGNTGLGEAFSLALAKAGANVFIPSLVPETKECRAQFEEIGAKVDFMEMIEKSVDLEDESYLIIESEPAQMYTSMVEDSIVQFGLYAGKTMDELSEIDEYLWAQLNGG